MNWILYPLAAFGALSLFVVLYFGWRIVRKWKAGSKATKEMLGIDNFGDIMKSPEAGLIAEIPDIAEPIWALANPDWINDDAVLARIGEFKALGFQSLGTSMDVGSPPRILGMLPVLRIHLKYSNAITLLRWAPANFSSCTWQTCAST